MGVHDAGGEGVGGNAAQGGEFCPGVARVGGLPGLNQGERLALGCPVGVGARHGDGRQGSQVITAVIHVSCSRSSPSKATSARAVLFPRGAACLEAPPRPGQSAGLRAGGAGLRPARAAWGLRADAALPSQRERAEAAQRCAKRRIDPAGAALQAAAHRGGQDGTGACRHASPPLRSPLPHGVPRLVFRPVVRGGVPPSAHPTCP